MEEETECFNNIECHRQPSLYYLDKEDDPSGPHLICDWNGPPTNFEEFDIDILSKMIKMKPMPDSQIDVVDQRDSTQNLQITLENQVNYAPNQGSTFDKDYGSQLRLLTVPQAIHDLRQELFRLKNNKNSKEQQSATKENGVGP